MGSSDFRIIKVIQMDHKFTSLKEFYPYYLTEHNKRSNRNLHYIGSLLAIGLLIYSVLYKPLYGFLIPIVGYSFAWYGHFFIEKNKPATFQYPFYSLASDFIMLFDFLTFQLNRKLEKARKLYK